MNATHAGTKLRNLTILFGSTTTVLAATIISPALPEMALAFADVPNADFLVRLALTMPALFVAIGALFAGDLLDRWGRKPVLIVSLLIYGLSGTMGFFLDSLFLILASRALLGLAVAGIMSGFTTLILDYFEGDALNRFLGLQGAFIGLGGMVFLLAAGFLADIGWRYPFLVHLFALLIVPGVIFAIQEPQKITAPPDQATAKVGIPWRRLAPVYVTAFVGMVIFFIFPVQTPFYLMANNEVGGSQVGMALSLQTLTSVIFALQYRRIKARFSFQAIFAFIFLAFSANHLIMWLSPAYGMVILALLIGGIGIGLFPPNNTGWLATIAPPEVRGRAVGFMTSALFLGQFFSPIFTEPLVQRLGLANTFGVMAGIALLISILFVTAAAKRSAVAVSENNA